MRPVWETLEQPDVDPGLDIAAWKWIDPLTLADEGICCPSPPIISPLFFIFSTCCLAAGVAGLSFWAEAWRVWTDMEGTLGRT